jgi:ubiquinone/menaquinone biosynthesis C-methylase UbiE
MPESSSAGLFLTPQEASRVYDRIGRFQDWQAVYESPAIRELLQGGEFGSAKSVLEFGCGTGAFAAELMKIVPADCRYVGIDVSPKMIRFATARLNRWPSRAVVKLSDGSPTLQDVDGAFDHFVANYVFDLLSPEYAAAVLAEAHRVLYANGKLCLASLGFGTSGLSKLVTVLWEAAWSHKPEWVGGCRPSDVSTLLMPEQWSIGYRRTVVTFGVPSEVIVASRRSVK